MRATSSDASSPTLPPTDDARSSFAGEDDERAGVVAMTRGGLSVAGWGEEGEGGERARDGGRRAAGGEDGGRRNR